ncbi:AAA family ATPase [Anabaena azotica]|uniref:AAA family ATPase n=1 Tax=Anabaena azotica FACHB-119 TaxID=947527 RepID=A0ABR8D5U8_9NOST|nr:AAA family ATPase [Anabaena azotica]MBD2502272.1 AAA family ATPase [Anabaena azotica FACHB-119]
MLKSVKIENFRGFKSFELQQLGRVNLLVGKNNTGKTSILEAIQLLCSRNNLEPLRQAMTKRGEFYFDENSNNSQELDVRNLFYGHEIDIGSKFSIIGCNDNLQEELVVSIGSRVVTNVTQVNEYPDLQGQEFIDSFEQLLFIMNWDNKRGEEPLMRPLSSKGGLPIDYTRRFRRDTKNAVSKVQFITSSSLDAEKMIELFDQIVLTPEEKLVEQAVNIIDSKIQRIAPISSIKFRGSLDGSRGGFFVLLSEINQRVPIGSMGDGVWRMLGLALATVCAKDGYLFVDEIDTGLHFTAMSDMWRMIWKTAKRLNVQVFATTHNSDCWMSLASIAQQHDTAEDGIRIHRIEQGKDKSIVFTEPQIVIAAEREIEVR